MLLNYIVFLHYLKLNVKMWLKVLMFLFHSYVNSKEKLHSFTYPELLLALWSHETFLLLLLAGFLQALAHLSLPLVDLILLPLGFLQVVYWC